MYFQFGEQFWNQYPENERHVISEIFVQSLERDLGDDILPGVKALLIGTVDRGVQCWSTFLTRIKQLYPDLETLILSQNYTYHPDNCCVIHGKNKVSSTNDLVDAFSKSDIKNLWIEDCQSEFRFLKKSNEWTKYVGGRILRVKRNDTL